MQNNTDRLCYSYYSSSKDIDKKDTYNFWFYGNSIRVEGDKPFSRGDVIKIKDYEFVDRGKGLFDYIIYVEVLGDPKIDNMTDIPNNLPVLLIATTPIPLSEYSEYEIIADNNSQILQVLESEKEKSKKYTVILLMHGKFSRITGYDKITFAQFEWLVKQTDCVKQNDIKNTR